MIDLHSHILPGLDDGAQTIAESRELAITAAADGIEVIAATPHVRSDYPTTAAQMEEGVAELRRLFGEDGIPVDVLHGGEIALDRLPALSRSELARFTIAQTGRYLLVETPYTGWPLGLEQQLFELRSAGFTAILAHPERNREVQKDPERLDGIVSRGTLVQITAASLDGRLGASSKRAAEALLELGLAHMLASDAHTPAIREVGMAAAAEAVGDPELAYYLTEETPAAIIAGERVANPPERARRRRRFGLF